MIVDYMAVTGGSNEELEEQVRHLLKLNKGWSTTGSVSTTWCPADTHQFHAGKTVPAHVQYSQAMIRIEHPGPDSEGGEDQILFEPGYGVSVAEGTLTYVGKGEWKWKPIEVKS